MFCLPGTVLGLFCLPALMSGGIMGVFIAAMLWIAISRTPLEKPGPAANPHSNEQGDDGKIHLGSFFPEQ